MLKKQTDYYQVLDYDQLLREYGPYGLYAIAGILKEIADDEIKNLMKSDYDDLPF